MKKYFAWGLLGVALIVTGCGKKADEQASLSGTGFDTLATEELAQLPQSSTSATQQTAIEVLPVETSPVTMPQTGSALETVATDAMTASSEGLSRDKLIQTALRNAGLYSGNIDGKIGPKTKSAIEEFQRANNLKVDGKVGPQTWGALQAYLTGQTTGQPSTGD